MDRCVMAKGKAVQRLADGLLDEMEKRAVEQGLNKTNVALAVWRSLTREFLLSGSSVQIFVHELFALRPAGAAVNAVGAKPPKSKTEHSLIAIVMAQALIMELEQRAEDVSITPGMLAGAIWDQLSEQFFFRGMSKDDLIGHLTHILDQLTQGPTADETAN